MAAANASGSNGSQPNSPPQYQMDQMSLTDAMDANRLALTRRLQLRRSVNELVDAGIYPSCPPAFAGQRLLLERAKTGDILKHKIEQRPARDYLVQHHILEDSKVDPSLQSTQRKLKKAKLTDELNEKLEHRPGPLELVEQRILEADDPLKVAIKEGKLEFQKTEEVEPTATLKLAYEVESPKSDGSSPEPSDCDNDSNASSTTSTGFSAGQVPAPPDITPLLNKSADHTSVTIGGKTLKIPITTQSFVSGQLAHQFTSVPHIHSQQRSNFGANRNNRRTAKQNRPKQQIKQRVIKFHEYKGPSTSKSTNSNASSTGTFVTTTGPLQKLDGLTPYQVRVQQQQLYLQCQLEIQSQDSTTSTVLVPIHAPPPSPMVQQYPVQQQSVVSQHQPEKTDSFAPPEQSPRSRPVTPSLSLKSPSLPLINNLHNPLLATRSLSHIEDMKVADLKHELKQRNLTVSGCKPQLIERLRNHQLQEMSASVPSVSSSGSEFSYSTNIPSVQSFSDDAFMAPPSVASTCSASISAHMSTPPPTPCTPPDELMRSPPSNRAKSHPVDSDETSHVPKTTAEIVREQAKQIEELQRTLMQFQQQFQMVQQPYVVAQPQSVEPTSQPTSPRKLPQIQQLTQQQIQELLQQQTAAAQQLPQAQQPNVKLEQSQPIQLSLPQLSQQQSSPVDITDKQVYLATPDGKMTAYKVILHTGSGVAQQMMSRSDSSPQPPSALTSQLSNGEMISPTSTQQNDKTGDHFSTQTQQSVNHRHHIDKMGLANDNSEPNSQGIDVDDVLEVLIRTGEMDPQLMTNQQANSNGPVISDDLSDPSTSCFSNGFLSTSPHQQSNGMSATDLELQEPLSPLVNMDWMDSDPNTHYLDGMDDSSRPSLVTNDNGFMYNDGLDWLSDVMHLDSAPQKNSHSFGEGVPSTSDPILTPKPPDVMNIFEMEEADFRTTADSGMNWDRLLGQTSHHM